MGRKSRKKRKRTPPRSNRHTKVREKDRRKKVAKKSVAKKGIYER